MLGECSSSKTLSGSPKKVSETENQLDSFQVAIVSLSKEIAELEVSLNPVLREQNPQTEGTGTPQPTLIPLANKLREMKNSVIISAEKIREIRERLEI